LEECEKLFDKEKVTNEWTTLNGVNGRRFTDKTTGADIFLPVGLLENVNESEMDHLVLSEVAGAYWSSSLYLGFSSDGAGYDFGTANGCLVRPVAE
jgi:hypothetical protein